jgi:threonine dehydrogenase-like Zn-dependent dehydrogenase
MTTTETMRRAVITGPRQVEVQNMPAVQPGLDEVLVRVHSSALCTFEQRAYLGVDTRFYPLLGGHELAGIVEAAGEAVVGVQPGDKVAISAMDRCGRCYACRRGMGCENVWFKKAGADKPKGPAGPAGLATHKLAKGYQVYKLHPDTDLLEAALTEPLACVLRSIKQARIQPGDSVVILGGGVMGALHVMLARGQGAHVIVSEPHAGRRQEALRLGAAEAIDPTAGPFSEQVKALTDGRGADVIIVATDAIQALEQSLVALYKGGRLLVYARMSPKGATIALDPNLLHDNEIVLTGTISQSPEDFQQAAEMITRRAVDLRPIISATYPLDQAREAFEASVDISTYRVVICP